MLNTAQNKKLLVKLTRALETYEPYVFTEICTLPFSMYETSERLTDVPEAALFQDPVQRPQGRIWTLLLVPCVLHRAGRVGRARFVFAPAVWRL